MDFPYIKVTVFPKHQKRQIILPWVRFGIYNPKNPDYVLYPLGLVDSGSGLTFVTHEFGEELGFDIKKKGIKDTVLGVGGGSIEVWFHKVGIVMKDNSGRELCNFTDSIAFTYRDFPASMPQQTAILGELGFFRHLKICFEYPIKFSE